MPRGRIWRSFRSMRGVIPAPLFDTQVAAMVCGFGEQVAYDTLARKIAKANIDKSSRFTDWSRRPLSEEQLAYALADVTHLRQVYEYLSQRLARTGRAGWVAEEMAVLNDDPPHTGPTRGRLGKGEDPDLVGAVPGHREGTGAVPRGICAEPRHSAVAHLQGRRTGRNRLAETADGGGSGQVAALAARRAAGGSPRASLRR